MSTTWTLVLAVGLATSLLKAAGPVALGGRRLPSRFLGLVEMLAPALFAALAVTQVFGDGRALSLDERAAGMAAALVAIALRAPTLAVIVAAAAVTAGLRAL